MISTVDFVPTDKDYEKAALSVEPAGKVATTWAQLRRSGGVLPIILFGQRPNSLDSAFEEDGKEMLIERGL